MSKVLELLAQKETIYREMRELRGKADAQGNFDADNEAKWQKLDADWRALEKNIEREQEFERREKDRIEDEYNARQRTPGNTSTTAAETPEQKYERAFSQYCRRQIGDNEMAQAQREFRGTSTQITTTDSLGGYLVPTSFSNQLERIMKYYGPMLDVADVFTTSIGGTLEWPTVDDTAAVGEIQTTEGGALTVADITFGVVNFSAYTFASGIIKVSEQLLNDEMVNFGSIIGDMAGERLGRNINAKLTTGTNSSQPNGIITASSAGKTAASATAFTLSEVVDLLHSVDRAYRGPRSGFMMHDLILAYARKLAVGSADANPLWQTSFRDGEPDRLLGYPVYVNNDMDSAVTTAKKVMLFADFSKYKVRRVGGITLKRLNELYAANLVVGFISHLRLDGQLIASGASKYLVTA